MEKEQSGVTVQVDPIRNSVSLWRILYFLGILISLMTMDAVISQFSVNNGMAHELNPLLKPIISEPFFLPLKVFHAVGVASILWLIGRKRPVLGMRAIYLCVLTYAAIVLWNITSISVYWLISESV